MSVEQALESQRNQLSFKVTHLSQFLYGSVNYQTFKEALESFPEISHDPNIYNKSRVELIKDAYRTLQHLKTYFKGKLVFDDPNKTIGLLLGNYHQVPGSAHIGMFLKYVQIMGTESQRQKYLKNGYNYQIVGCYAQTELGHGSDIRSLQTTATFDETNQEFVINTPSISAAKFWPGEISIIANHAIIFAQLIIKGKSQGVFSFMARIKDKQYRWLSGVEGGDIGPKIGFHAKENGFLVFSNFRIPKDALLSKFVTLSPEGVLKMTGDPRISYGGMMHIRVLISCYCPRIYGQAITIAVRYGLFRKQFKRKNEQIAILNYQAQQYKLLPRIAEYYALTVAGNAIFALSNQNTRRVEQNDLSLMPQTHSCLSFSKCLFSEIVYDGIETCRRACGGNGFSCYSGFPGLLGEYAAHVTHEGENTVMYLQDARYVLKNYQLFREGKQIADSVSIIASIDFLMSYRRRDNGPIRTLEDVRILLGQGVCSMILRCVQKINTAQSREQGVNYKAGIFLQQLSKLRGIYYTYKAFEDAVLFEKNEAARVVLIDLCLLFGITQLLKHVEPIITGGFITAKELTELRLQQEHLLKQLRPSIIGLVDAICLPEKLIRSQLVRGNPYQNYLKLARENQLNKTISASVAITKSIKTVLATQDRL